MFCLRLSRRTRSADFELNFIPYRSQDRGQLLVDARVAEEGDLHFSGLTHPENRVVPQTGLVYERVECVHLRQASDEALSLFFYFKNRDFFRALGPVGLRLLTEEAVEEIQRVRDALHLDDRVVAGLVFIHEVGDD